MACVLQQASDQADDNWRQDLRARLRSPLQRAAEHPKAAQLGLVDAFAAGPAMQRQMRLAVREFEQLLTDLLAASPERLAVPHRIVQGMVAGVTRVTRTRVVWRPDAGPP